MTVEDAWERFKTMYPEAVGSPFVQAAFFTAWRMKGPRHE